MIDSFLYFNETDLLRVRLEYLNPHVDKFVIVETDTTFSLQHHPAQFDKIYSTLPEDIRNKIVYQYLEIDKSTLDYSGNTDNPDFKSNSRIVEVSMRETLSDLIRSVSSDDWMMMSDLDEIWDPRLINESKKLVDKYGKMFWAQDVRTCFFDWQMTLGKWPGTKTTRVDIMPTPTTELYCSKNKTARHYGDGVLEGGWHLTMMGSQQMKGEQISAKREGPGWEKKIQKTSEEISQSVFDGNWNSVAKKKKMRAIKVEERSGFDLKLYDIAKQYPGL
jgi:beta-1,4-mannosyl-glycoprotein beta-1,4-N-acetylglucosaminyltransferase